MLLVMKPMPFRRIGLIFYVNIGFKERLCRNVVAAWISSLSMISPYILVVQLALFYRPIIILTYTRMEIKRGISRPLSRSDILGSICKFHYNVKKFALAIVWCCLLKCLPHVKLVGAFCLSFSSFPSFLLFVWLWREYGA